MYPLSTRPGCKDSVEGFEGRDSGDHDASRASLKKWGRMNPYAYQDHRDVLCLFPSPTQARGAVESFEGKKGGPFRAQVSQVLGTLVPKIFRAAILSTFCDSNSQTRRAKFDVWCFSSGKPCGRDTRARQGWSEG
ncbi:unnamed protein product [Fusarium graminearum]|nr:unnamed protein product [Fusarium graminearum]